MQDSQARRSTVPAAAPACAIFPWARTATLDAQESGAFRTPNMSVLGRCPSPLTAWCHPASAAACYVGDIMMGFHTGFVVAYDVRRALVMEASLLAGSLRRVAGPLVRFCLRIEGRRMRAGLLHQWLQGCAPAAAPAAPATPVESNGFIAAHGLLWDVVLAASVLDGPQPRVQGSKVAHFYIWHGHFLIDLVASEPIN